MVGAKLIADSVQAFKVAPKGDLLSFVRLNPRHVFGTLFERVRHESLQVGYHELNRMKVATGPGLLPQAKGNREGRMVLLFHSLQTSLPYVVTRCVIDRWHLPHRHRLRLLAWKLINSRPSSADSSPA